MARTSARWGLHWTFLTAYSWPRSCVSQTPPTAPTSPGLTILQSQTFTILSTPALAKRNGWYLFQSMLRISVPDAGTVNAAAWTGFVKLFTPGPAGVYPGVRRSNILTVPSVEHVASISGWWGEKRAWYTHAWWAWSVATERGRSGVHCQANQDLNSRLTFHFGDYTYYLYTSIPGWWRKSILLNIWPIDREDFARMFLPGAYGQILWKILESIWWRGMARKGRIHSIRRPKVLLIHHQMLSPVDSRELQTKQHRKVRLAFRTWHRSVPSMDWAVSNNPLLFNHQPMRPCMPWRNRD